MKKRLKLKFHKPILIGLSMGSLGVFYFYLNQPSSDLPVLSEACGATEISTSCEIAPSEELQVLKESAPSGSKETPETPSTVATKKPEKKKSKNYRFMLMDSNGDGRADAVDVDLDGEADYILGDLDGDLVADFADLDGDTISDVVFYDDNKDGIIDTFDVDMNQRPDGVFVDRDGDGFSEMALLQRETEICYERDSGLNQVRSLTVKTASLSDYLSRGAKIGSCDSLLAKRNPN